MVRSLLQLTCIHRETGELRLIRMRNSLIVFNPLFLKMQRLALLMFVVVASLAMSVSLRAEDASDLFLSAYQDFQTADKLVGEGSLREALEKYEAVEKMLLEISKAAPDWQPLVVEYRLKKTRENIGRLRSEVADLPPKTEAIEGDLPQPDRTDSSAPIISTVPVVSGRPPPGVRSTPRKTPPQRRRTNSVQDQIQGLKDDLTQARQDNERLNANLQSALMEVDKNKVTVVDLRSQLAQAQATLENTKQDDDDFSHIRAEFDKRVVGLLQKLTDAEADREVLIDENARLFAKLDKASTYIASSDEIRDQLLEERTKLAEARDTALSAVNKKKEKKNDELDLLTKENEKLKEEMKSATKDLVSKEEVDRLKAENASLYEAVEAATSGISIQEHGKLVADKEILEKRLEKSESELAASKLIPLVSNPDKDALIASLQSDLNSVNDRLLEAQARISRSDEQVQKLREELDQTAGELAQATLNPKPSPENEKLSTENELLRGIILRQINRQTLRDDAKKKLEEEIARLQVKSDVITSQLEVLGSPVLDLTPSEQTLFKEPVALLNEPDPASLKVIMAVVKPKSSPGDASATGTPDADGTSSPPPAPERDYIPEDVRAMVVEAKEAFEKRDYPETERIYQAIIERVPDNYFALSNLAAVQIEAGKLSAAEVALKKAIEINAKDSFAYTNLGILYSRQGRFDEAIEALNTAISINDKDSVAHNYLGVCLGQKSKREDAEEQFKRAIELNPSYPDAHFNLAVLYATTQPQLMELAKHYYIKATELGAAPDPSLEHLIQ